MTSSRTKKQLAEEIDSLRRQLQEAKETLEAIQSGSVDALVINGPNGHQVFTLQGAERTYRILVESLQEGAATLTSAGIILYCNTRFADLLKLPLERVIGSPLEALTPLDELPSVRDLVARSTSAKVHAEVALHVSDGTRIPVYLTLSPLPLDGVAAVCLVATDLTDQKRAEETAQDLLVERAARAQAEEASQTKTHFIANISHDLRTPLNSIIGMAQVLLNQAIGPLNERQKASVDDMLSGGRYLMALLNDVLDISKGQSGQINLQLMLTDLIALVENSIALLRQEAQERAIVVETELNPDLPFLLLDSKRITQVLVNLLSNAIKFTPPGGRVGVRGFLAQGCARVEVWDTGIGIAPTQQHLLFKPFVQLQRTASATGYQGTGLGLALSKQLVELHGGTIGIISRGEGYGSTFWFTLPLPDEAVSSA